MSNQTTPVSRGSSEVNDEKNECKEAFALYDRDKDGLISTKDLGTVLRALGRNLTVCEETDIVAQYALDNCYEIDCEGFLHLMSKKETEKDDNVLLVESFKIFDKEETGYVRIDELRDLLTTKGEPLTEEQVDDWFRDGQHFVTDNYLFYEKFVKLMLSK